MISKNKHKSVKRIIDKEETDKDMIYIDNLIDKTKRKCNKVIDSINKYIKKNKG